MSHDAPPWGSGPKPPGWDEYQARKAGLRDRTSIAIGTYQTNHPEALAEIMADERREARKDKRRAEGRLTEHEEQCLIVQYLEARGMLYFAVPNGGKLHGTGEAIGRLSSYLRAEGLTRGAPDLVVEGPRGPMLVEVKAIGGRLSPEQAELHAAWRGKGATVLVGYGHKEVIGQIEAAWGRR